MVSTASVRSASSSTNAESNTLRYGAIPLSERTSTSHATHASMEEAEDASLLLEEERAKFDPRCVFESEAWGTGVAGMGDEISNLLKNIVGSGGLSIPGGIATFANAPSAILPSVVVLWIMGLVNAYSFSLLGRICAITKSHTYGMAWERTAGRRYGSRSQLFVDCVVFGKAILGTWSFSIIIASTCTPLVRYVLFSTTNGTIDSNSSSIPLSPIENGRHVDNDMFLYEVREVSPDVVLATITLFVLLPLCLSQRLGSLSVFSAIGTLGTFVTITTMLLRFFDGSYQEGGEFFGDLEPRQRPSFGTERGAAAFFTSLKSLTLVSILSTGYVAHYNAPKYYYELKDHTTGKFNVVVTFGFLFAAITYTLTATLGFLTFGQNSLGFILDNYSYRDPMATAARFGVAVSVIFAYPLLFHGGRDGLLDLLKTLSSSSSASNTHVRVDDTADAGAGAGTGADADADTSRNTNTLWVGHSRTESNVVTVLLLFTVTSLAISVNDLTFVLSFSGATMSSLIIYIFPPLMFSALVKNCCCYVNEDTDREVKLGTAMMIAGIVLGVAGAYVAVERAFF